MHHNDRMRYSRQLAGCNRPEVRCICSPRAAATNDRDPLSRVPNPNGWPSAIRRLYCLRDESTLR